MTAKELAAAKLASVADASDQRPVAIQAGELRSLCQAVLAAPEPAQRLSPPDDGS